MARSFSLECSYEMISGILYRRWEEPDGREVRHLLLAPKSIQEEILRSLHDLPTAGHFGVKKTMARVRQLTILLAELKIVCGELV